MPRKIPKDWDVIRAIEYVLKRRKFVTSNESLCYLTQKRLKEIDGDYVVSPSRVRKIALEIPEIRVRTKTKKTKNVKRLKKCPVCKSKTKMVFRKDLSGQRKHIGYRCDSCGFRTNLKSLIPMKYTFIWKNKK